jgi:acyl-CoA thioesterase
MATTGGPDGTFERETASQPDGDGRTAELPERWLTPWGQVNGGFAAGVAVRGAVDAAAPHLPASATVQFLRPVRAGAARLVLDVLWTGDRTMATRVTMVQGGEDVLVAMVWTVERSEALEHHVAPPPDLPEPDIMATVPELLAEEGLPVLPLWDTVDVRPTAWVSQLAPPRRDPVETGWIRVLPPARLDDPGVTVAAAFVLVDMTVVFPVWHPHGVDPITSGFAPMTLDLAAQFFDVTPGGPWLRQQSAAPVATRGLVGGRASLWSPDGRLVAFGIGQMMLRPPPPA